MQSKNKVVRLDWSHDDDDGSLEQVFKLEPSYKTDEQQELFMLDHEPSILARLVLPSFRFFKFIGISPSSFSFDPDTKRFVHTNGSVFGRVSHFLSKTNFDMKFQYNL